MSLASEAKKVIHVLEEGHVYVECPCCGETVMLRDSDLFYLDNFSDEAKRLYQQHINDLKQRRKDLRERRKTISQTSEVGAKAVNIGSILERIAPTMDQFPFECNDCRSLFDPIDYLIFEGLSKKSHVDKIIFVEIKTGGSRLKPNQRNIRDLVQTKKVVWNTYDVGVKNGE